MMSNTKNDYYQRVYRVVERIPYGRVTTYGTIAQFLGIKSAARMVGYALNQTLSDNHENALPAHRVVNRRGALTGRSYFPDDTMKERLQQEDIDFVEEYVVDLEKHFWDPADHLDVDDFWADG